MKTRICGLIALYAAMGTAAAPQPRTVELAQAMMKAMGGEAAWKQPRYIRFDFIVKTHGMPRIARTHLWDRQTGRYRLEDKAANDDPAVWLFNVRDGQGVAYVRGKKLEGAPAAAALKGAMRTYRMDFDWLALPWNWLAPDVHPKYVGEKTIKGKSYDVVDVAVDGPDQPQRYKTYISKSTHLLEMWSVAADTSLWDWQYDTVQGLRLGTDHINEQNKSEISMGDVKLMDHVDDAYFTDPKRKLDLLK